MSTYLNCGVDEIEKPCRDILRNEKNKIKVMEELGMSAKVTILPHGPILVAGVTEVIGSDGKAIAVTGPQVALCRCGHSKNKPFCDGGHRPAGFKDPQLPV